MSRQAHQQPVKMKTTPKILRRAWNGYTVETITHPHFGNKPAREGRLLRTPPRRNSRLPKGDSTKPKTSDRMKPDKKTKKYLSKIGKIGGQVKSVAKTLAAQNNGKKGGRPKNKISQPHVTPAGLNSGAMGRV